MRYLSRIFMTLSALCFAMPAFAQGGGTSDAAWVAITAGFSMAIASAVCGLAQGKAVAVGNRVSGAQSRGSSRDSVRADSGTGADRVAGAVHTGDHLLEGEVGSFEFRVSGFEFRSKSKASASAEAFLF